MASFSLFHSFLSSSIAACCKGALFFRFNNKNNSSSSGNEKGEKNIHVLKPFLKQLSSVVILKIKMGFLCCGIYVASVSLWFFTFFLFGYFWENVRKQKRVVRREKAERVETMWGMKRKTARAT